LNDPSVIHGVTPFYFEGTGGSLYACMHEPEAPARPRAFVICPPFGHEYLQFHRALRLLGNLLCEAGFPVLRFDLHGCGDSSGDAAGWSMDRWFTDTCEAVDELRRRTGIEDIGLIGLRLGGAIATRVAAARPDIERLVLWDPVFDGTAYLTEMRAMQDTMLSYAHVIPDAKGSRDEVLGYALPSALATDIEGVDLTANIETRPAEFVLLVETHDDVPQEPVRKFLGSYRCKLANTRVSNPHLWSWVEDFGKVHVPRKVLESIVRWANEETATLVVNGNGPGNGNGNGNGAAPREAPGAVQGSIPTLDLGPVEGGS
jgi:pimeloyl-ACP methyl ester carboxylesterase